MRERRRKVFHMAAGAAIIALAAVFGTHYALVALSAALFAGLYLIDFRLRGYKDFFSEFFLKRYDRKEQLVPAQGALTLVLGSMLALTFLPAATALGILAILSFGDGFASLVGRFGETPLPWNRKKSLEGLAIFVVAGAGFSAFFMGFWSAFAYALLLGLLETVDSGVDDNLLIPAGGIVLNALRLWL